MAQLREITTPVPPAIPRPARRRLPAWCRTPFTSLRQAWRSQTALWERWQAAPYKDDGPLRWQRRDGSWALDGADLPRERPGTTSRRGDR